MSVKIKLANRDDEKRLLKQLTVNLEKGSEPVCFLLPTDVSLVYRVPFHFGKNKFEPYAPTLHFPIFLGSLRNEQVNIFENAKLTLFQQSVVMISCYTGFGKTITTLALACYLKLKTLIVVHRICLFEQWTRAIKSFCSDNVVLNLPSLENIDTCHFAIVNIATLSKIDENILSKFGLLITDETHLLLSEKRSKNLLRVTPKKFIGLTATPYRPDELHCAFKLFFGSNFIIKKLQKLHYIYEIFTKIKIENKKTYDGMLDWNYILKQQSENEERNNLIVKILQQFPKRTWLILVKRKSQASILESLLKPIYTVSLLIGTKHSYDADAQILIGTVGKIGTGFDHPKLDSLLIATDMVEYYIQFLGRIMRRNDVNPIVVDLIDDHPILYQHYIKRKKVYLEHGGVIKRQE